MKHISRILAVMIALCMVMAMCAFADDDFEPVEGTIHGGSDDVGYDVAILGAEAIEDYDDEPAIAIYYSFTNNGDEVESAWSVVYTEATEEGYTLDSTSVWDDEELELLSFNDMSLIYPGVTILCADIYTCNPDDDVITFSITDYWDEGEEVSYDFSYSDLPGRPDDIDLEEITEPVLTEDLDEEGDVGDEAYVAITDFEVVDDYDEGDDIRITMDFTNTGDEENSLYIAVGTIAVFQDGVELGSSIAEDEVDSDDMWTEDIDPDETATCSRCYKLLNDTDPVEVVLFDYSFDAYVGMFCEID